MFTHPKRITRTILVCSALIFAVLLFAQTSKRLLKPVVAAPTIAASTNSPASLANSSIASSFMPALGSCASPQFGPAASFPGEQISELSLRSVTSISTVSQTLSLRISK